MFAPQILSVTLYFNIKYLNLKAKLRRMHNKKNIFYECFAREAIFSGIHFL